MAEKALKTKAKGAEPEKSSGRVSRKVKQERGLICDNLSFAAAEAYKLLRTNLRFSMPEKPCSMIGVTSSLRGEGKSTTSVNLAYTFAQSGKRVLLIDADMRLPSVSVKLDIRQAPGLSNLIAGLSEERDCLVKSGYFDNWYILPAGDIPPNPSELLGSERMHSLLNRYADVFDIIIIDLPPVNLVSDALVISQWIDGLIAVVRENYTDKRALADCVYQIRKLGAHFLGFVMTDASVDASSYKRYGKYGKKYGYGYGYDSAYAAASPTSSKRKSQAFLDATADDYPSSDAAPQDAGQAEE